jgi:hypothetical protein
MKTPLPFLEGVLRGLALGLAVLVLMLASRADAAERWDWRRVAAVESVAITVHVVSGRELAELAGVVPSRFSTSAKGLHGYAELRRNRDTGAYTCALYVVTDEPVTLEHETRHCYGWAHQ